MNKRAWIQRNPEAYSGQNLTLYGTVTRALTLPGTELTAYYFEDGSAGLLVLANKLRRNGDKTFISGEILLLGKSDSGVEASRSVRKLADMLKEKGWMDGPLLDVTASALMEALKRLSDFGSRIYFFVEN